MLEIERLARLNIVKWLKSYDINHKYAIVNITKEGSIITSLRGQPLICPLIMNPAIEI